MTAPVTDPVAQAKAAIEYCYERGWTDGLPVVPATRSDIEACLATTDRDPAEIIGSQSHLGRSITVAQAAANAAMSMVFRPFGWAPWSGRSVPVAWKGADHL